MTPDEMKALVEEARHLVGIARGPGNFMEWSLRDHAVMVRLADTLEAALSPLPDEQLDGAITRVEGDINRVPPNAETARTIADIRVLLAEVRRLRALSSWDGEWRTIPQSREEAESVLMRWTKRELVERLIYREQADLQRTSFGITLLQGQNAALKAELERLSALSSHPDEETVQ